MIAGATHQARPCDGELLTGRAGSVATPGTLRGVMYGVGRIDAETVADAEPEAVVEAVADAGVLGELVASGWESDGCDVEVGFKGGDDGSAHF